MMIRERFVALVLALFVFATTAHAGARATLILASGERVRGVLADMGGSDFTVTEGDKDTRIPIAIVAVIDFVGGGQGIPATETSKIQAGRHLVFKRGGDAFYGRLTDMRGDNPLILIFSTPDGPLELSANDAGRIYLQRWEGMPTGGSGGSGGGNEPPAVAKPGGYAVPANVKWVDTGVRVRLGQSVTFNASGQVILSGDNADTAGPAGAGNGRVAAGGAQMPGLAAGALIGKVGNSAPFGIGNQTQALRMPAGGLLFLAVNDNDLSDNRGEYRVQITLGR